jgi:hypothetical protein
VRNVAFWKSHKTGETLLDFFRETVAIDIVKQDNCIIATFKVQKSFEMSEDDEDREKESTDDSILFFRRCPVCGSRLKWSKQKRGLSVRDAASEVGLT